MADAPPCKFALWLRARRATMVGLVFWLANKDDRDDVNMQWIQVCALALQKPWQMAFFGKIGSISGQYLWHKHCELMHLVCCTSAMHCDFGTVILHC